MKYNLYCISILIIIVNCKRVIKEEIYTSGERYEGEFVDGLRDGEENFII